MSVSWPEKKETKGNMTKKKKIWALSTWLFHRLWLKKQNYYLMRRLQLKWCQWENIMQKTKLNLKLKLIKWNLVWSRNITSSLTPCCFFNGDVMVNITDELHLWFFFKPHISFNDLGSVLSTAIRVLGGRVCADSAPLWDVGVNNDGLAAGSGVRQKSVRGGLCKFDWQNQSGLHQFNANY